MNLYFSSNPGPYGRASFPCIRFTILVEYFCIVLLTYLLTITYYIIKKKISLSSRDIFFTFFNSWEVFIAYNL